MTEDNKNVKKYMERAIQLARSAAKIGEVPVACVIVYNGEIIAEASNKRESEQLATAHAEILAINKACKKLNSWRLCDADLYVTLEPCLMCSGAIIQSRIRKLYFSAYDPKSGMAGSVSNVFALPSNHQCEVQGGILEEESSELLRNFFKIRRKKSE